MTNVRQILIINYNNLVLWYLRGLLVLFLNTPLILCFFISLLLSAYYTVF